MAKRNAILHPVFLISLLALLFNDFYLKPAFSNLLTGKLSDFAGLIVFPTFIAYLIPNTRKWISSVTGILFAIWKTPLVSPLIEIANQNLPFGIQRVIDYSDYWALLILPFTHKLINQGFNLNFAGDHILKTSKIGLALLSFFAICATSIPPPVEMPKGTIYIGKQYIIKKGKEETIEMIRSLGYNVDYHDNSDDSTTIKSYRPRKIPYYQTDNIVIYGDDSEPVDTILQVKYTLYEPMKNRTRIEIINVTLSEEVNIQRWQTLKYLRRQYKKMLELQMIKKLE